MNVAGRLTLGGVAIVLSVVPRPLLAQAGNAGGRSPACSLVDETQVRQITGFSDVAGRGPMASDADELPAGVSGCDYVTIQFLLKPGITPQAFESLRASQVRAGYKVEPLAGIGDVAFSWWNPKPGSYRQVGVAYRRGTDQVVVSHLTRSDSIEIMKPRLVAIAKTTLARLK